jgi:hypothetical protein
MQDVPLITAPTPRRQPRAGAIAAQLAACALLLVARTASATLGQPSASALADGTPVLSAHQLAAAAGPVSEQTVLTPDGVVVDEFSADGMVFALSWAGATVPDLAQILGGGFAPYARAQRAMPQRAPLTVNSASIVAHTWGHLRDVHGCAYVPALVPPGVDLNSLGVVR